MRSGRKCNEIEYDRYEQTEYENGEGKKTSFTGVTISGSMTMECKTLSIILLYSPGKHVRSSFIV